MFQMDKSLDAVCQLFGILRHFVGLIVGLIVGLKIRRWEPEDKMKLLNSVTDARKPEPSALTAES